MVVVDALTVDPLKGLPLQCAHTGLTGFVAAVRAEKCVCGGRDEGDINGAEQLDPVMPLGAPDEPQSLAVAS